MVRVMSFWRNFQESLSLDLRSLALYRFFLGLVIVADVVYRLPDLTNFYTDLGLVPRSLFLSEMAMPWSFSLHLANGSFLFAVLMFSLHLVFGLMVSLGYKTRWAVFGAYIMTVSVHNRNWLVNNGGDDVLRALLLISIFLPLNRMFSMDSGLRKERPVEDQNRPHFSTWSLTLYLQVFVIYFISYVLKDHPIWREEYSAVFYSSRLDVFSTPLGRWLRDFPTFLKFSTMVTINIEFLAPLLLLGAGLLGRRWWILRCLTLSLFWGLHLGIILTMWIGVFPYLCLVMWMAFIPGPLWDRVMGFFRRKRYGGVSIYYDKDCGFCQKGVRIIREFFLLPEVPIIEAQSSGKIQKMMEEHHSWVITNAQGEAFFRFGAFLELMKHSPLLKPLRGILSWGILRSLGERIYIWVSHHRSLMGKLTQFLTYESPKSKIMSLRLSYQVLGVVIFATLLAWNLSTIKKLRFSAPHLQTLARWLHIYQEWSMFAPYPKRDNIWIEIPSILGDGSEIELLSGDRNTKSMKFEVFPRFVPNEHWRKFYLNMSDRSDYARYYGGFLCRQWNERKLRSVPEVTLNKMDINVYSRAILPNGKNGGVIKKFTWTHWCFPGELNKAKL